MTQLSPACDGECNAVVDVGDFLETLHEHQCKQDRNLGMAVYHDCINACVELFSCLVAYNARETTKTCYFKSLRVI